MADKFSFNCEHCGEEYHSQPEHIGKLLRCLVCGNLVTIAPVEIKKESEKVGPTVKTVKPNSKPSKKPVSRNHRIYILPIIICVLTGIGSLFHYLFPLPVLAGLSWLGCWMFRKSDRNILKVLSGVLRSTAIGLSLLLLILIVLNSIYNGNGNSLPGWLLTLDNLLIWSRENLKEVTSLSAGMYLLVVAVLLIIARWKPGYKPFSRYVRLQDMLGKILAILIVITSFTFFAHARLDATVDNAYYKNFKVSIREKLKQERRALIAHAIAERMQLEDSSSYVPKLSLFHQEITEVFIHSHDYTNQNSVFEIKNAANADVAAVMNSYPEPKAENADGKTDWEGAESRTKEAWEQKVRDPDWVYHRKAYTEQVANEVKKSTLFADEAVVGAKDAFKKMMGTLSFDMEGILGVYIEDVISSVAEYLFEKTEAAEIVKRFFDSINRIVGQKDLFGRIAAFWYESKPINIKPPVTSPEEPSKPPHINGMSVPPIEPDGDILKRFIQKNCSNCGRVVSKDAHPGQICPHCKVIWMGETKVPNMP